MNRVIMTIPAVQKNVGVLLQSRAIGHINLSFYQGIHVSNKSEYSSSL
jgi:hypothetical protein